MVIKTTGLQYDDRVRKEFLSLHRFGIPVYTAVLEGDNIAVASGMTDYASPYTAISLSSRRWLPHAKGLPMKTVEMYARFATLIARRQPRVLWLHNMEMAGLVPYACLLRSLGRLKSVIWDQHELPHAPVLENPRMARVLKWLMLRCDHVIVANEDRRMFLASIVGHEVMRRVHVVDNHADSVFVRAPRRPLPKPVIRWLNGGQYVLAQGGGGPNRHLDKVVAATIESQTKLIVVGAVQESVLQSLRTRWAKRLDHYVMFVGMVPQMKLVPFIDHARASVVFYGRTNQNNWLCAPNRMYQALARGIPVVVGENPPMRRIVEAHQCGVVAATDGSDVHAIRTALDRLLREYIKYKEAAEATRTALTWEGQEHVLLEIAEQVAPAEVVNRSSSNVG